MDSKELRGLMEAYAEMYAPEQLDEVSSRDEFTRAAIARSSGRKGGITFEPGPNWDPSANRGKGAHISPKQKEKQRRKALRQEELDIFDVVLEFLQVEGYAETLEEAEWLMSNVIDEEAIDIILGEAIYSEKGKAKAAEMIAKRSTPSGRAKSGKGANVAQIRQIRGSGRGDFDKEGLGGTPMTPTMAKNPRKKQNYTGTGNKAARRAGLTPTREKPNAWKEDFKLWVNGLVEEGYDLSNYTWDEMCDIYEAQLDEVSDRLAKAARNTRERRYNASFGDGGMSANYSKQNAKKNMLNKTLASRAERTGSKIKPVDEEYVDEALTGERYKKVMNNPGGTAYSRKVSADPAKRATRGGRGGESDFGAGDRGSGNKAARRAGTYKEAFEAWLDEAMSNYEKNRKRAAQRAAARNEARKQGKTGAVPGVGYVTPRPERETWTDESGKTRHAKGL